MCGIAAIFAYRDSAPSVEERELIAIRDQMRKRGPDGEGIWFGPNRRVGLGHRRLAIIDLSPTGAQPMLDEAKDLAVVYNGEIYNYREIREALEVKGYQFKSDSDTEVLLHLWSEYGAGMLQHMRGMYAFALWDGKKQGLFLARDPFGIKPLYVSDDGQTVRVASQVKALLAGGQIDTSPNPAGHVGYFLWGHVPDPHTLYRGITAVAAGCSIWIDRNGVRTPQQFASIPQLFRSVEQGPEDFSPPKFLADCLSDSIRYHLLADVPVGCFLSAGIDSATLVALASEQKGRLKTVTLGFDEFRGTMEDETVLAGKVARHYATDHQTVWVTRRDFQAHHDKILDAMDQPSTDGINAYFVSLAAVRSSLKVSLSGLGGDEIFGGYSSFTEIPRVVETLRPLGHVPMLGRGFRKVTSHVIKGMTSPKYAGLFEYGSSYSGAYLLRRGMFMPWELPGVMDPEMARTGWEDLRPLAALDESIKGLKGNRTRVSTLEMTWYMRDQLLRDSDWASMAHSLELRVPFVDLEFVRNLAPYLQEEGLTKRQLAATPATPLPDAVVNRVKTGFTVPVKEWLILGKDEFAEERGLRGWARHVYSAFQPA